METTKLKASLIIEGKYEGFYIYYKDVPTDILRDISILTKEYLLKKIAKKNKYISAVYFPRVILVIIKIRIYISGPFQFVGKLLPPLINLQKLKVFNTTLMIFYLNINSIISFQMLRTLKNYVSFVISELDVRLLRLAKHTSNISKIDLKKDNEIILTKKNNDTLFKCKELMRKMD